jgi:hypothetical protein
MYIFRYLKMKKILVITLAFFSLTLSALPLLQFPEAEISNGLIRAKLYLPDQEQGYYRGSRFDWSGVISSLEYKGHSYFGKWFGTYHPRNHESIMGPVDEFTALGFADAKPGQTFLKIGVGELRKEKDEPQFRIAIPYEIVNPGKWTTRQLADRVEFTHELTDAAGYSYLYRKTVRLAKGKPELVLEYSLKNTGKRPIETTVYNHNFFMIDQEPTGPGIVTTFPFEVTGEGKGFGEIAELQKNQLLYLRELNKGEHIYSEGLKGFGNSSKDYDFRIENVKTGAGVRLKGDQPLSKLVFWASSTTSCPEPYIQVKAAPGKEAKWKIAYEFYTTPAAAAN